MVNYKEIYENLLSFRLITPIWKYVLEIIENEIKDKTNKDYYLVIFSVYFSLIDDGNICISLDKDILLSKWKTKVDGTRILLSEKEDFYLDAFEDCVNSTYNIIKEYLNEIDETNLSTIIGENRIFEISDNWLYVKKYNVARLGVIENIDKLFSKRRNLESLIDYRDFVKEGFRLSSGQERALVEGLNKNLIITGGPGTGKTTSILFLLISLLKDNARELNVHLIAPSGKASSRMKESIINGLSNIKEDFILENKEVIEKIKNLEESTIHRLLGHDYETNGFEYNKNRLLRKNSLFVIDESSMIDICLFNSLLEAIPDDAMVYIMGDKNQLPSVECGAVFGDLLKKESLKENIVELDESIRFKKGTKIYELASAINNGLEIPVTKSSWRDFEEFKIEETDPSKPIYYYSINKENYKSSQIIEAISMKWGEEYFKSLQDEASDLDYTDLDNLNRLFKYSEISKILCAENKGLRGVENINKIIKRSFIDYAKPTSVKGYYPGMIMMINKNNKMLDLYNGDSGILVTFANDPTLYFMVRKSTNLVPRESKEQDKIFKLGDFTFYPLRLIAYKEIDLAYAITIHKSQGSDYPNILVILPDKKGHPLLNRQIVYTAITRTKGNTYILSNQERLLEAKDTVLIRDTNII